MFKKTFTPAKEILRTAENGKSFLKALPRIGALLKEKAEVLKLEPKDIAPRVKRNWRTIYSIYKRKYLTIPEMMLWSEILNENLFAIYHPNIKPQTDPRDEEIAKLKSQLQDRNELENELASAKARIAKLEAQKELLEEQLEAWVKRRG